MLVLRSATRRFLFEQFNIRRAARRQQSNAQISAWCSRRDEKDANKSAAAGSSTAAAAPAQFEGADLERMFIDDRVQSLLKQLTGFDLGKLYKWRMSNHSNVMHYALMTDNMYNEFMAKLSERAEPFLQFVPLKEPRPNRADTLAVDPIIAGQDTYKMVFVDISFDTSIQDRTVVIREPNGRLRTALPEEHYRMDRIFFEQPDRPVKEPPLFGIYHSAEGNPMPGHVLKDTLKRNEHEYVLDWACYWYEPDDPKFVDLCKCIFDRTIEDQKLDLLYSTRHFGTLAFYMLINGHIVDLLNFYAEKQSLPSVANTIRLHRIMFPDWKTMHTADQSDLQLVQEYLEIWQQEQQQQQHWRQPGGGPEGMRQQQQQWQQQHQRRRRSAMPSADAVQDELEPLRSFVRSLARSSHQQAAS